MTGSEVETIRRSADRGESVHRYFYRLVLREIFGFVISGVRVADDGHARIGSQDPLDALCHRFGSVRDGDLPSVKRATNTDSATIVNGHPRSTRGRVQQ